MLVLFLLATNIAVIITYRNHLKSETSKMAPQIEVPDSQLGRFFRDELSLSNQQHEQFREFRQHYNQSANTTLQEMQTIRNEMIKELDQEHPDRVRLDMLANEIGEKHKDLKEETFDYYFNLQSVLNTEQRARMVIIFQSMLTDEGYVKTHTTHGNDQNKQRQGKGRGQGKGRYNQPADSITN